MRRTWKNFFEEKNTGFGTREDASPNRFIEKDGLTKVHKIGSTFLGRISWFHVLIQMPWLTFILWVSALFICINFVYATIYFFLGPNHIIGLDNTSLVHLIFSCLFFSIQTFTTVGYGHTYPASIVAGCVSSIQAFTGLLFFAWATGLLYGRFSHPRAYIKFSQSALITPFKEGKALMFRLIPYKNNHLADVSVKLVLAMHLSIKGKQKVHFFPLKTEHEKISSLVLSWTVVHPIDKDSPLYGCSYEDIVNSKLELFVYINAFDEVFSNTVLARTSYLYTEIVWGAKFTPMYQTSEDYSYTELYINKLNEIEQVKTD